MGIAYRNAARFEEAENAFREALRLNPHLADIHLSLGSLQLDMGHYEQGLSSIRGAVRLTPKNADAHRYLGELWPIRNSIQMRFRLSEKPLISNATMETHISVWA